MDWLFGEADRLILVPISLLILYAVVLTTQRLAGLRSYSKMSGTDFVTTIATGSLLGAAMVTPTPSVLIAAAGLVSLLGLMVGAAWLKRAYPGFQKLVENDPLLLMNGSEIIEENLARANVTRQELHGKLRENNVWNYGQVIAVVYERTGDMAVLSRPDTNLEPDPRIFSEVSGPAVG